MANYVNGDEGDEDISLEFHEENGAMGHKNGDDGMPDTHYTQNHQ